MLWKCSKSQHKVNISKAVRDARALLLEEHLLKKLTATASLSMSYYAVTPSSQQAESNHQYSLKKTTITHKKNPKPNPQNKPSYSSSPSNKITNFKPYEGLVSRSDRPLRLICST